jgi:hypothetical protein
MIAYAGIGSRTITTEERTTILVLAAQLSKRGCIVYSGNADGADIAFQTGSGGNCVIMLPYLNFNVKQYDLSRSLAYYNLGRSKTGQASIDDFHPAPRSLTQGGRCMMARNFHQVMGVTAEDAGMGTSFTSTGKVRDYTGPSILWPRVSFVVCCSDENEQGVIGGTGQACRIAASFSAKMTGGATDPLTGKPVPPIPVYNLRKSGSALVWSMICNQMGWDAMGEPAAAGTTS